MADELNGTAPAVAESAPASIETTPEPQPAAEASDPLRETFDRIYAKNNPPRENGKFAPHNPAEAAPIEAAPAPETTDQAPTPATEQAPEPAIGVPQSWSAEEKALWAKVPPEAQSVISRRETEAHRQITQMGQQIKAHEPLRATAEQHADYLRQIGRTPEDAFKEALGWSQALGRNAAATIGMLANRYGVDLKAIYEGQPQQQSSAPQRDAQLYSEVNRIKADLARRQEAEQADRLRTVTQAIKKFEEDKSHPHFKDLEDEIETQVAALQRTHGHLSPDEMLAAAYEKAKWAHPTIRERILSDQRKADEEKRKTEQEKQVKEARRQQPFAQKPGVGKSPVKGDLDSSIRRNLDRVLPG